MKLLKDIPNREGFRLTLIYKDGTIKQSVIVKGADGTYKIAKHSPGKTYEDLAGWRESGAVNE